MAVQMVRWRFTAEDLHRMAETGILKEDDRVELIDGEIVKMSAVGSRHVACVIDLTELLATRKPEGTRISVQSPISVSEYWEPEPDLALVRSRNYRRELPRPADILLVIEVADTTFAYDRGVKLPMYARAGIPESWLVDLPGEAIERHSDPSEEGYHLVQRLRRGDTLEPASVPGLALQVDEVLG